MLFVATDRNIGDVKFDFFDDKFQGIDYQIKFLMVLIISDKLFPEYLYKFIPWTAIGEGSFTKISQTLGI